MKNYSECFISLCGLFLTWTWQELLFGINSGIIVVEDIVKYTNSIISEEDDNLESLISILIADLDEVEDIIEKLASKEERQNDDDIVSKWVFLIIYYYNMNNNNSIFDIIDDLYCEFDYPPVISELVSYMPKEDGDYREEKLKKYIENGKTVWLLPQLEGLDHCRKRR